MRKKLNDVILKIIAILVVIMVFLPIILMLPTMLKTKNEMLSPTWTFLPQAPTFENFTRLAYLQVTTIGVNFFSSLLVTILVAAMAVVLSLAINMIAAFAFARLNFPLKKIIWVLILFTMFIPGITILITSIRVVSDLKMLDTIWVLVVPGLVSAYNLFFFRQFFIGFPQELDEAAKVDGATIFQIFTRIYLPMSKTPMVIIGASIFMGYYNSYVWPSLTISDNKKSLFQMMTVLYKVYNDASAIGYGTVIAGAFIAMIPPLIVFVIVQRYIRDGIQLTGIK